MMINFTFLHIMLVCSRVVIVRVIYHGLSLSWRYTRIRAVRHLLVAREEILLCVEVLLLVLFGVRLVDVFRFFRLGLRGDISSWT